MCVPMCVHVHVCGSDSGGGCVIFFIVPQCPNLTLHPIQSRGFTSFNYFGESAKT